LGRFHRDFAHLPRGEMRKGAPEDQTEINSLRNG
jgi:hypothetical protein